MIIKEVPAEGNLTIEVSLKEIKLEFHSQCVESGVNYIYAQPIRMDGKILSFNSEGHLMVNLIYLREEKNPIVWKGVGITTVQNNGKNVYKIVASGEGFEMNRRESFRLFLGLGAVVQIGSNKKAVNVILKDISENGFSFVEIEDIDAENLPVRLVFNDMKTGISLIGNIVRKVTVGEKKIIYGCTLTSCNIDVARYINEKQRQFLAASRSSRSSGESNKEALKRSLREPTQYESALKAAQANQDSKKQGKRKKG